MKAPSNQIYFNPWNVVSWVNSTHACAHPGGFRFVRRISGVSNTTFSCFFGSPVVVIWLSWTLLKNTVFSESGRFSISYKHTSKYICNIYCYNTERMNRLEDNSSCRWLRHTLRCKATSDHGFKWRQMRVLLSQVIYNMFQNCWSKVVYCNNKNEPADKSENLV